MYSLVVFAVLIVAAVAQQHVSVNQDTLGNYNLKYVIGGISRVENRDIHGNVVGGYSYIDPHGFERSIQFTSGAHGFNAIGSDIPHPVPDTPEVAHAKAAHLNVLNAAYLSAPPQPLAIASPQVFPIAQPFIAPSAAFHQALLHGGIPDTPEVAAAKAEHLALHAAASGAHFQHL